MMVHRRRDLDRANAAHDEAIDPDSQTRDDDLVVYARREDSSRLWKASWYLQKYLVVWGPLAWILTALGFGLITPTRRADELREEVSVAATSLQRQIDTLRATQLHNGEKQDANERALNVLVRQACIDRRVSLYDKQLIGLLDSKGECIR